jgi:hypothetical protein
MHPTKRTLLLTASAIIVTALLLMAGAWRRERNGDPGQYPYRSKSNAAVSQQKSVIDLYSEIHSTRRQENHSLPNGSLPDPGLQLNSETSQLGKEDNAEVGILFREGLRLIQEGRLKEGEDALSQFVHRGNEDPGSSAPARWATELKDYGADTLEAAASYVKKLTTASSGNLSDGQYKKARFIVALIYADLTNLPESPEARKQFAFMAQQEIRAFLERWPDGLMSVPLRLSLARLEQSTD